MKIIFSGAFLSRLSFQGPLPVTVIVASVMGVLDHRWRMIVIIVTSKFIIVMIVTSKFIIVMIVTSKFIIVMIVTSNFIMTLI